MFPEKFFNFLLFFFLAQVGFCTTMRANLLLFRLKLLFLLCKMKMMKKKIFFKLTFFLVVFCVNAQKNYQPPLNIPLVLSANFGELRPNHFHSGIDFKTQGVINKPVYSIEDGHVSRILVSPGGYGLALYIVHPSTGEESVYGHLNKFIPEITDYVKQKQYEQKQYRVDLKLGESIFPVHKGDLIAYSGNTGSSGGPHLHFEIRDSKTQRALDVIPFYKEFIKDTKVPHVRGIAIYPLEDEGVLNGSTSIFRQSISLQKSGVYSAIADKLYAWGKIGFGIHANDYMDNTNNIYGVKSVKLFCDSLEVFSFNMESVDFDTSKMINSLTDYDYWYRRKIFYMKSFLEKGNTLDCVQARNGGYVDVCEERTYNMRYDLEDVHGNISSYSFEIIGQRQDISLSRACAMYMSWDKNNYYVNSDFTLIIPPYSLYDDLCFSLEKKNTAEYCSKIYQVNDRYIPLDKSAYLKLKLTSDTLQNKQQYGVVTIDGKRTVWIGGRYQDGFVSVNISRLGNTYAVTTDTELPQILPVSQDKWLSAKRIQIKVTDNLSGIVSCNGTIDGEFVLFEHDVKSPIYTYLFDTDRLGRGKHKLEFTAIDGAGNKAVYNYEFEF